MILNDDFVLSGIMHLPWGLICEVNGNVFAQMETNNLASFECPAVFYKSES